jgi:hypothetical protein
MEVTYQSTKRQRTEGQTQNLQLPENFRTRLERSYDKRKFEGEAVLVLN